jgi:hypothetical protein
MTVHAKQQERKKLADELNAVAITQNTLLKQLEAQVADKERE